MTYSSEVLADSPLAYWRLGDANTLVDSSGNARNGAFTGGSSPRVTGLVSGDTNGAHSFASGARGQVTDAAWMDATSFTVMATITPSTVSGTQTIVSRYGSSFSVSSFTVRLDNNKVGLYIFSGGGFTNISQSTTLSAGTTYDVAATYNGSTGAMTLYVNGSSVATGTQGGMNNASTDFAIGARPDGSEPYSGVIDDVAFFGSVLTGTQIANFATQRASGSGYATSVLAATPLAYYRLDEPSVSGMADSSGNGRNGTYQGTPTMGASGALLGDSDTAIAFSSGKYATTTYAAWQDVTTALTLEAWVKVSTSGDYRHIITKDLNGSGTGGSNSQWQFRVTNVNKVDFAIWHTGLNVLTSTSTLSSNTWYHVVATYSASTGVQAIYINGTLDASTTGLSGNLTTGSTPLAVGAGPGSSPTYAGTMSLDELAVYNAALSSTRVAAHYTAATSAPSASGTASLSLSASGATGATSGGAASLSLSASGSTSAPASGTASLNLSAIGSVVPPVAASGSASLSLSAGASATASPAGAASLALLATATAQAILAASGTATLNLSATGSAVMSSGGTAYLNLSAGGVAIAVFETDLSNALDGLDLLLTATVVYAVPVAAAPAGLAERYDVAIPYPVPVMVDGRPT